MIHCFIDNYSRFSGLWWTILIIYRIITGGYELRHNTENIQNIQNISYYQELSGIRDYSKLFYEIMHEEVFLMGESMQAKRQLFQASLSSDKVSDEQHEGICSLQSL